MSRLFLLCLTSLVLWVSRLSGSLEVETAPNAIAAPGARADIVLVGDSTVTVESGWGRGFATLLKPAVVCVNAAQGGRSSKSYRAEGFWQKALAVKGRCYLIQFGHNDQPGKGPLRETDPNTTFRDNLARFVAEAREQGAEVILVTSLTRRTFDPASPGKIRTALGPWAEGTRAVGQALHVPVIDLHALSIGYCEEVGPERTAAFNFIDAKGGNDTTHLRGEASLVFARLVAKDLVRLRPDLRSLFLDDAF